GLCCAVWYGDRCGPWSVLRVHRARGLRTGDALSHPGSLPGVRWARVSPHARAALGGRGTLRGGATDRQRQQTAIREACGRVKRAQEAREGRDYAEDPTRLL